MTNKKIIIDGINVSECDHLKYDNTACDILNIINNTEEKY